MAHTFEKLEHRTYSGETHSVPLLIKDNEVLDEESTGLLRIANIIGREDVDVEQNVLGLISEVARVQRGLYSTPVMVADNQGGGAFTIDVEKTRVVVMGVKPVEIPTQLFFEFLNQWADFNAESYSNE